MWLIGLDEKENWVVFDGTRKKCKWFGIIEKIFITW